MHKNNLLGELGKKIIFLLALVLLGVAIYFAWVFGGGLIKNYTSGLDTQATSTDASTTVGSLVPKFRIFFQNDSIASTTDCSLVYPVEREYTKPEITLDDILSELFKGPTKEEKESGYSSVFSGRKIQIVKSLKIASSTAYLNLYDIRKQMSAVSASCGSAAFLAQVGGTLKENAGVDSVVYAINGNPKTFYDWIQVGCSSSTNNCDPSPFK